MKHQMAFSRMAFVGTLADVSRRAAPVRLPLRPRNAEMDALVKHAATSEEYSFEAVCKSVGDAFKKATT